MEVISTSILQRLYISLLTWFNLQLKQIVRVTGLRSLSTFAIGFLLTRIISPVFQMVGRSWMAVDSWKMKWMMGKRLYMHFLSRSVPILSGPGAF